MIKVINGVNLTIIFINRLVLKKYGIIKTPYFFTKILRKRYGMAILSCFC